MSIQLTIIVPVFNEEGNIERLENKLKVFLESAKTATQILFVNDGSSDKSQILIKAVCERNKHFNFISFTKNQGLSAALKAGFDFTETPFVGYIDADLQTSPMDFNLLIPHIKDYALVTGIRENRQDSFFKKFTSRVSNATRRLFTKDGVKDTGCPLKIMQTHYAKQIPMFRGLHRFLPAMIQLQNGKVKQVLVNHFPRISGTTKFSLKNRFIGPIIDCFVYLWMKKRFINYKVNKKSF